MSLLFVFAFVLKGILYPSKGITSVTMSKHQLTGYFSKKALTLEGKMNLLDANKERKQSCRQVAEMFNIGQTAAANIIKNEASIFKR